MIVTMSEKAAREYLSALSADGVAASVEVYQHPTVGDNYGQVAVLVVPLNGYEIGPSELLFDFVNCLMEEGYLPFVPGTATANGWQVPTGDTGPKRTRT